GGKGLADDGLDDGALSVGAVEVAIRQRVAFADVGECAFAGDGDLALGEVVVLALPGLPRVVDGDAAQCIGEPDEPLEINGSGVVHPYAGQLLQRLHRQWGPTVGVGPVDLALAP